MKAITLVLLCFGALVACAPGRAAFEFYVVTKPDETAKFLGAVTSIAKDNGLETAVGKVTFDTGHVLSSVEGRGHGLTLWVQNVPLSGDEDPRLCGVHHKAYVDPAQFIVYTEPRFFETESTHTAAVELGEDVLSKLRRLGFDVRREPVVCGAAVIHGS
jgi:hypothetical protein